MSFLSSPTLATAPRSPPAVLERLHPALWRASQMGAGRDAVTPSGFAALDAELPGGGWPHRALTELLLPHPGLGELRLLAPALAQVQSGADVARSRSVMLLAPPAALSGWALGPLGLDAQQLFVVQGRLGAHAGLSRLLPQADVLWALEQALKSGHVGALLAWLPAQLKADVLRRLQLAAQAHDGPAFLLRGVEAAQRPSAAPLRLQLQASGPDALSLRVLKRRGPVLGHALRLALPPVLSAQQRQRAQARRSVVVQVSTTPAKPAVMPAEPSAWRARQIVVPAG